MKKLHVLGIVFSATVVMLCFLSPANSYAEVRVNVAVPLPPLVIPAPPALTVVPGTYVYYPPDVGVDIFFFHGFWYRPYGGRWYRSVEYSGPWRGIAIERVPRVVIGVPPGFRRGPIVYEHVPYRDVRTNWRAWERDRHWDRNRVERREHHREDEGRREHEHGHEHERHER
jgi:hypothetical protein